jgi:hypothetical protein
MFGRKQAASAAMDEHLSFMSESEAAEFRALLSKSFAAEGVPVEVLVDHALAADGRQFGLWNIAAMCHGSERGRADWEGLVAAHVQTLLNPPPAVADMTDEELLERVHSRLYDAQMLAQGGTRLSQYGREVAEGVIELLVADFPETVVTLWTQDVAARDADALWAAGRGHTLKAPVEAKGELEARDGAKIVVAMGESFYLASRIVDMPSLLVEVFGERRYPHGVVVGAPHRHQVVLHPLDDMRSVHAIGVAAHFTATGYSDAPGGVSPLLYWWNGDGFQTVSRIDSDGAVGIHAEGAFLDAVNALGEVSAS